MYSQYSNIYEVFSDEYESAEICSYCCQFFLFTGSSNEIVYFTAGTFLKNHPLPIINISELVSRLAYGSDVPFGSRPLFNHVYE